MELKKVGLEGIVMSARWLIHFGYQSIAVADQMRGRGELDEIQMAQIRAKMQASLDETLTALERTGLRTVVLAPTPQLIYSAPKCFALRGVDQCNVPRSSNQAMLTDVTDAMAEVVNRHSNARLLELVDFFRDAETCHAVRDGKLVYYDDDHITTAASRDLGRYLAADLAWLRGKREALARISQ